MIDGRRYPLMQCLVRNVECVSRKIIIKNDQEPAILEDAKVKDSQSNGKAERALQEHEEMLRTIKLALQRRLERRVPATHPLTSWLA